MGARSKLETTSGILLAFVSQNTWPQAELARRLGIQPPALRKHLVELQRAGVPLDRDEDPPHVYWSVPKRWFPAGVTLAGEEVAALLRCLSLAPQGPDTRRLRAAIGRAAGLPTAGAAVSAAQLGQHEEDVLWRLYDAAMSGVAQRLTYATLAKGTFEERFVTVVRVVAGERVRFAAACHRSQSLKWFRLERVRDIRPDPAVPPLVFPEHEVERYVAESVSGYHGSGKAETVSFFVRGSAARWVSSNLPAPWPTESADGGLRVRAVTAAISQVARFVVSLGADAHAETPALAEAVRALALGALTASARESVRSVTPIRAGGSRRGGGRRRRA